jgi:CDP-diacylglycerol--serine O-phosphatidyltransferase
MPRSERKIIPRGESMKKGIYLLPNLLTSASLFCGFYSIVQTHHGNFENSAWAIIIALIFDAMDGKIARATNTSSHFGMEYDSLTDLISFGVAPGFLVYVWALTPFGKLGWVGALIFVLCAALRLARFNVQVETVESRYFNGLPVPAAAALIATLILFYIYITAKVTWESIIILYIPYGLAILMVSNIKYYAFKDLGLIKRKPFSVFALLVVIIAFTINEFQLAFFLLSLGYVASGLINFFVFSPAKSLRAMFQDR